LKISGQSIIGLRSAVNSGPSFRAANPRTGERIYAGRVRGSESNPFGPATIEASPRPQGGAPYWVFGNDFDWRTFDFDHDMDTLDEEIAARLNANTADLEEFKSHGGKLILYHGFADPQIPTLNTVAYYERLIASQTREGRHDKGERKEALPHAGIRPAIPCARGGALRWRCRAGQLRRGDAARAMG